MPATLTLIGIGCGSPGHLTRAAIAAINGADLILIPRKGEAKTELAELRRMICAAVLTNPATRIVEFDVPVRETNDQGYLETVDRWHTAIGAVWVAAINGAPEPRGHVAMLIWGDPSLYDSSLRIARRLTPVPEIEVIPGITAIEALCAAHAISLNEVGKAFVVTTGRNLVKSGWPTGVDTVVVMLDGSASFQSIAPDHVHIWWGAYLGMPGEILIAGPLREVAPQIVAARDEARSKRGWIMDTYLLRRAGQP